MITDQVGSVRLVVNAASGVIAEQIDYDEFGNTLSDTLSAGFPSRMTPFGFAGGLSDADTGLERFGARDYDPTVGRWTEKDRLRFGGGSASLYGYVGNDPVNAVDPTGESAWSAGGYFVLGATTSVVGSVVVGVALGVAATAASPVIAVAAGVGAALAIAGGTVEVGLGVAALVTGKDPITDAELSTDAQIDLAAGLAGGIAGGVLDSWGYKTGTEFEDPTGLLDGTNGKPARFAPWGNRTGHEYGEWPHYHRSIPNPKKPGQSCKGQGLGNHRPWEAGW